MPPAFAIIAGGCAQDGKSDEGGEPPSPRASQAHKNVSKPKVSSTHGVRTTDKAPPQPTAFMPCDGEEGTTLRVKPSSCDTFSSSNGVGPGTIAEGARVTDLHWKSWGRKQAKAVGTVVGQKTYDPDTPATVVVSGQDCGEFVVYATMVIVTDAWQRLVQLDGDCDHLSSRPEADPTTGESDQVDEQLERNRRELERQQEEIDAAKDRECERLYERWQRGRSLSGGSDDEGREAIQEYGRVLCDQR